MAIRAPFRQPRPMAPPAAGICEYGCGRSYTWSPGARLRGHPGCLVELGDDLLGLMEDYPRLTYPRLAKDLGIGRAALGKIIEAAMRRQSERARQRALSELGIEERPRPLTPTQRYVLGEVIAYWREVEIMPGARELATRINRLEGTARMALSYLRLNGWITHGRILHVLECDPRGVDKPRCALECPSWLNHRAKHLAAADERRLAALEVP